MRLPVRFTAEQCAVITARPEVDMVVEAGPGSGKSRTVAGRVAWLLLKEGIPPSGVVAITFTDAAAATLQERVAQILDDKAHGSLTGLADLTVSTIHAFLLRLLLRHVPRYRKYRVLAAAERDLVLCSPRVAERVDLTRVARLDVAMTTRHRRGHPDPPSPFLSNGFEDRRRFFLAADVAREECIVADALPDGFRAALAEYGAALAGWRCWDYSELLSATLAALCDQGDADCLTLQHYLVANLRCVLVDEYNDVNPVLVRILLRLRELGTRVVAIGDADQTCFRFRGSDPTAFDQFRRDFPDAERHLLSTNHRSSSGLVVTSRSYIDGQRLASRRPKPHRVPHEPRQQYERGDLTALRFGSVVEQDAFGVARLRGMYGAPYRDAPGSPLRGLAWHDMMILTRTNTSARRIAAALRAADVPVELAGNENLLESPEARAIAALYDVLGGRTTEDEARAELLAGALGINAEAVERGLSCLREQQERATTATKPVCLIAVMYSVLGVMRFHQDAVAALDGRQRELVLCNVARLLRAAQAYQTVFFRARPDWKFADFARWLREDAPRVFEDDHSMRANPAAPDAVRVMTVHRAKGDEAAFVWIADLHEDGFPHYGARPQVQNAVWQVLPRNTVSDPLRYDGTLEDEARLFFVALSRPAKFLLATYGRPDQRYDRRGRPLPIPAPSRYLHALERDRHFVTDASVSPPAALLPKERPTPRDENQMVTLSFSDLLVYFTCPHQFRLRVLYGFPPAASEAIGFAESLHRCCARFHEKTQAGEDLTDADLLAILEETFHVPNAGVVGRERMLQAAQAAFRAYAQACAAEQATGIVVEQEVEVRVGNRLRCVGRFDMALVDAAGRRLIEDWKTSPRAAGRDRDLLVARLYALGYETRTGERVDAIGTRIVDGNGGGHPSPVPFDEVSRTDLRERMTRAERALSAGDLPMLNAYHPQTCDDCDTHEICLRHQEQKENDLETEIDTHK